jgi:hypothetical protein
MVSYARARAGPAASLTTLKVRFAMRARAIGCRGVRQINPTGKSAKTCPDPRAKIFRLTRRANQRYDSARLTRYEGRAHVTNARWDAVDADSCD